MESILSNQKSVMNRAPSVAIIPKVLGTLQDVIAYQVTIEIRMLLNQEISIEEIV